MRIFDFENIIKSQQIKGKRTQSKSPEVPFHGITLQKEKQDQEKISAEQK